MALTFLQMLSYEVGRMQAAHPEREAELARAHALILHGMVVPSPDDPATGQVLSSDQQTTYHVNGSCTCPAGQHGKDCKHQHAWKLYQYIQGKFASQTPQDATLPTRATADTSTAVDASTGLRVASGTPQIPAGYYVEIQGQHYVRVAGLLWLAHQRGLQSLTTTWTYNDAELSLAQATAVFPFGAFTEAGDASPSNVNRKVAPHFRRCALSRATGRVLRVALGVDSVAAEELMEEAA
jgi:hypothetical protein